MSKLKRLLQGKTKTGQVLYGIVDILPIPNVLNLVRAAMADEPEAKPVRIAQLAWCKVDKVRMAVALVAAYLVVSGNLDTAKAAELATLLVDLLSR